MLKTWSNFSATWRNLTQLNASLSDFFVGLFPAIAHQRRDPTHCNTLADWISIFNIWMLLGPSKRFIGVKKSLPWRHEGFFHHMKMYESPTSGWFKSLRIFHPHEVFWGGWTKKDLPGGRLFFFSLSPVPLWVNARVIRVSKKQLNSTWTFEVDELKKLFLADGWTIERLPRGWLGKGTIHQVWWWSRNFW